MSAAVFRSDQACKGHEVPNGWVGMNGTQQGARAGTAVSGSDTCLQRS